MAKARYEDLRDAAQFDTLWKVVVHATAAENETPKQLEQRRLKLHDGEAADAMVDHGHWRGYEMVRSPVKGLHVGYRFIDPKHWFFVAHGVGNEPEGPFVSKKIILRKLQQKTSKKREPGIYSIPGFTIFTRDMAEQVIGKRMTV